MKVIFKEIKSITLDSICQVTIFDVCTSQQYTGIINKAEDSSAATCCSPDVRVYLDFHVSPILQRNPCFLGREICPYIRGETNTLKISAIII